MATRSPRGQWVNTLRPRQNGCHFPDDILEWIFLNENVWISIEISLKFVPKGQINNIPALVQIMAWCRRGDKPLSEPMMIILMTHICVTRPKWVNYTFLTEVICSDYPPIPNAKITQHFDSTGQHVSIECKPGYQFHDDSQIRSSYCSTKGTWSGNIPKCERKNSSSYLVPLLLTEIS